jgi:hypothetical protein
MSDIRKAIEAIRDWRCETFHGGFRWPYKAQVECMTCQRKRSLGEGNFFASPSIDVLAAAQDVTPLRDSRSLGGVLAADEVEDFIGDIYRSRE